jgi:N-acetylmuramoyl-L-alanine amidase
MPSGKKVTPLFGKILISLSAIFCLLGLTNENKALAAKQKARTANPYIVVLDPGHGGADTGASGKLGKKLISEKEVALAIALRAEKILSNPAFSRALGRPIKVLLTRRKDSAVSLEERSDTAKKAGADLFVSIHANSEASRRAHGLETYFLNNTDDESALKLQQIENRMSKRNRGQPGDSSLLIRSVAADAVVESSRTAAEILHSSVVDELRREELKFQDRGVRQAMLYVLLDAQVPAVLMEAFFLSHKDDLALVSQPENRARIAEGLAKGVLRFLAQK